MRDLRKVRGHEWDGLPNKFQVLKTHKSGFINDCHKACSIFLEAEIERMVIVLS